MLISRLSNGTSQGLCHHHLDSIGTSCSHQLQIVTVRQELLESAINRLGADWIGCWFTIAVAAVFLFSDRRRHNYARGAADTSGNGVISLGRRDRASSGRAAASKDSSTVDDRMRCGELGCAGDALKIQSAMKSRCCTTEKEESDLSFFCTSQVCMLL